VRLSSLSDESAIPEVEVPSQSRQGKFNKIQSPFPHMFGPRCVRFAGVINNATAVRKNKKVMVLDSQILVSEGVVGAAELGVSQIQISEGEGRAVELGDSQLHVPEGAGTVAEQGASPGLGEEGVSIQVAAEHHHNSQGLDLSVCLPFPVANASSSGVRQLLNEDTIKDVDGFINLV
jgi:hypothetical protein